jgi:glycosyltransferase involved in cell wall biosynthesis
MRQTLSPPKVWFAIPGDLETLTGGYIYARRLIANLQTIGWHPEVLALPSGFPRPTDEEIRQTRRLFEALPPGSLVLVDGLAFGAIPHVVLDGLPLNFVALVHHPLALETGLTEAESQRLKQSEQTSLRAACCVIVTSPFTAETLIENYSVPRQKVYVALPGTDPKQRAARNKYPPRLLTVATVTHRKGYDVLVAALAKLTDLEWISVSIGSLTREPDIAADVQALAQKNHITERIQFRGEVAAAALEAEYNQASIFVLPSRYEGYGMAFADALAHGLPIVACATGAVATTVPSGASFLVPPDDVDALSFALRRLLRDPDLSHSLSQAAWQHAQGLPSWHNTATSVASALSAAMQ